MPSEQAHSDAVVDLLNELGAYACDPGEVPRGNGPDVKYTTVYVTRVFGGEQRASGERDGESFRITLQYVARIYQNVQNLRDKSWGMKDRFVTVEGIPMGPINFESSNGIGPDDGWFSASQTWTYSD